MACRKALLEQLELEKNSNGIALALPIEPQDELAFGSVKPVLDLVLTADTCLVVTGKAPEQDLAEIIVAERKYPTRFAYRSDADTKLRQLALAGTDVVLLPCVAWFPGYERAGIDAVRNLADREDSRRRASARFRL